MRAGVLFAALRDWFESPGFRGCAFQNAAVELADPAHAGTRFVREHKRRFAVRFARTVVAMRGVVDDADIAAVRDAGYGDAEIAEVVAHVALNIFTNYFNNVAGTTIDFPKAPALSA